MGVLIWTVPGDAHARAVEWVLKRRGVPTKVWLGPDFPRLSVASIHLGSRASEGQEVRLVHNAEELTNGMDVFWRRRSGAPSFCDDLHAGDRVVAVNEANFFINGLNYYIDQRMRLSVNSEEGALKARSKALQLHVAQLVGLSIPETLITNDPDLLIDFYAQLDGKIIIKSFSSPTWKGVGNAYFSYSTPVTQALLAKPVSIRACPAIYQKLISKRYEVRAFFAGKEHLAVRLDSQTQTQGVNDWRKLGTHRIPISQVQLPDDISKKCILLMENLGIVTGSFDFAVTDDDEYIFFEVNEQGQFLWMEANCPAVHALQLYCDFLVSKDKNFCWTGECNESESFASYVAAGEWQHTLATEKQVHVEYQKRRFIEDDEYSEGDLLIRRE